MIALVHTEAPRVAAREAVARVAFAVLAVHVADRAIVRTEPGTSAADHLLSGLVPIAVALGLALAYPALRRGPRAAVALSCGALGIVAGATAGIPSLLAGAALLAVGFGELRRLKRGRLAFTFAGLVVAYLVVLPVGMAILGTNKPREDVVAADLGKPYDEITLKTRDGLELAAWYVAPRNGATVIAFPGRRQPVPHARLLVRHGYGVLLLDPRGTGESDGDVNRYGWGGAPDLDAAIDFLVARGDRIGGLGLSVGGELMLEVADRRRELRAVVSEGAGARSLREPEVPCPRLVDPGAVVHLPGHHRRHREVGDRSHRVAAGTQVDTGGRLPPKGHEQQCQRCSEVAAAEAMSNRQE